tara:strand:+ start:421 stop:597 length:177 start_codon:yes stop_codon:yes gene_type:complete
MNLSKFKASISGATTEHVKRTATNLSTRINEEKRLGNKILLTERVNICKEVLNKRISK